MLSMRMVRVFQLFKQTRSLSEGLILKNAKKLTKPKSVVALSVKKKKAKKRNVKKPHIVVKTLSDDIEGMWLENLNKDNLKLYRKTSFGSFRKVNTDKLLEKLHEIFPTKFGITEIPSQIPSGRSEQIQQANSAESNDDDRALPYMSDFLVQHMVQFPLFKAQCDNNLSEFLKEEKRDFGKIDSTMFPSVTGILSETMSESSKMKLKEWKEGMIEKMGQDKFNEYQKDLLTQGSRFHSTLKRYLEIADKRLVTVDPQIEGCWKSLENLLPDINNVRMVEECIYHPILAYRGIVDCVATYRDTPCVIEWKKSTKPKQSLSATYDAPLQLCAYLGALTWNKSLSDFAVKNGLVVVAYTDGSPANVFQMDLESCEVHWVRWLRRLQSYWLKKSSTLIQHEV